MKTIIWDLDDVLHPWYAAAHEASIRAGIAFIGSPLPTTWYPYEEYGVEAQAWFDALATATADGSLYGNAPVEGAVEVIEGFHELGYAQHFVTARGFMAHADAIREQTLLWVEEHFGSWYGELIFTREKGIAALELGATHAIDDNVSNCLDLHEAGVETYLADQTWNQDAPAFLHRVHSIDEFAAAVLAS